MISNFIPIILSHALYGKFYYFGEITRIILAKFWIYKLIFIIIFINLLFTNIENMYIHNLYRYKCF